MSFTKSLFTILFMIAVVFSSRANANFTNEGCMKNYREGTLELHDLILDYNEGYIGKGDFTAMVSLLKSKVASKGLLCKAFTDPKSDSCASKYKKLYIETTKKFKIGAIISGNQDHIDLGAQVESKGDGWFSGIRNFFNELSNDTAETVTKAKIYYYDSQCGIN
ncbi:MAG: hypothetical protein GY909_01055 [Oligoflexia bacterium]|nr:hypothetical protein [Oligoflexia bacterium]